MPTIAQPLQLPPAGVRSSRQVRRLRESGKVVVASVADVAASGGYYIAMGCERIVCDDLSITGSIGVVSAVLKIGELLEKVRESLPPGSLCLPLSLLSCPPTPPVRRNGGEVRAADLCFWWFVVAPSEQSTRLVCSRERERERPHASDIRPRAGWGRQAPQVFGVELRVSRVCCAGSVYNAILLLVWPFHRLAEPCTRHRGQQTKSEERLC